MKSFFACISVLLLIVGCKKAHNADEIADSQVQFSNVLILGNSITFSAANPSIGWNGNWGMAATSAEKDYVHLLTNKFKQQNPSAIIQATNISAFELHCETYNFDAELKLYKATKPDLLIIRIGENVQSTFDPVVFANRYQALINYFKTDNPNLKVLTVGSFWPDRDYVNAIMSKYSPYISLTPLGYQKNNYAFDMQNVTDAVKGHPGDKGMQGISDLIWTGVKTLSK